MNIQRYKLPAIIAASLHGALFLLSGNPTDATVRRSPEPKVVRTICEIPLTDIAEPDPNPGDTTSSGGGSAALPEIPDRPVLLPDHTVFTVPVTEGPVTIDHKGLLSDYTGLPPGDGAGWAGGKVTVPIDASKLDREPRARVQPSPDYPARLRQDGVSGSVVVEFVVNTTGVVVRAEATRYTHREFVEPALRAVRHWRFEPGRRDGRVVPFRMSVPIEFGIERS